MDAPMTKDQLLGLIQREHAAWDAMVAEVGEARMEEPGVAADWSFKDLAAHLTVWRQRDVDRLQAVARGVTPPPEPWEGKVPDDSNAATVNHWIYVTNRDRPLRDVLAEADTSLTELEAGVAAISEDELFDRERYPWMEGSSLSDSIIGNSPGHYFNDHEPDVRAWIASR